jgi:hypothetical protein
MTITADASPSIRGHAPGFGDLVGAGSSLSLSSPTHGQTRYSKAISVVVPAVRRTKSAERHMILVIIVQSLPQEGVLNYGILNESLGYRPVPDQFLAVLRSEGGLKID